MDWLMPDPWILLSVISWLSWVTNLGTIAKVVIGIGLVIFVHELGHFLAAKACGVKCEKFYVGFDVPIRIGPLRLPRALARFQWGETEYGIGVIPLGGYVKMLGQDDNPANAAKESERVRVKTTDIDGEEAYQLDPRSYLAKSVWQRMVIISAGVIMNIIFAVVFGAVAYKMGVPYLPCEVAGVRPGDPAWTAGLSPGDKIIQLGDDTESDDHLRFRWELQQIVAKQGIGRTQSEIEPLAVRVRRGDQELDYKITPTDRLRDVFGMVSLGIYAANSNRLGDPATAGNRMGASQAEPPLETGDRVVKFNGKPLDARLANEKGDVPSTELDNLFAQHASEEVALTVERENDDGQLTLVEIRVPPTPMRTLGLTMKMGPVVAIRHGSPAAMAGFREGDLIELINGEPLGDPLTLPVRILHFPEELVFDVVRGEGEQQHALQITLTREPAVVPPEPMGPGMRLALPGVGVAYDTRNIVASIESGGPAEKAGVQVGDEVRIVQFLAEGEQLHGQAVEAMGPSYNHLNELDNNIYTWAYIFASIQAILPDMDVELTVRREGQEVKLRLRPVVDPEQYYVERGLRLASFSRIHRASDWADATSLGLRETREKVQEVGNALYFLFSGSLSVKALGGPIRIAQVAGTEAAEGIPRLLIFLTLLSANLAILNFLPIPALDGGHMLFLLIELVRGKPVNEAWQQTATAIGVLCLLGLMAFVVFNDIVNF